MCKFVHVTLGYPGERKVRSPPCGIYDIAILGLQALGMDETNTEQILTSDPRLNAVLQSLPLSVRPAPQGLERERSLLTTYWSESTYLSR